jgi:hypothetical protein
MMDTVKPHYARAWWKRPPVWVVGIAAVLLFLYSIAGSAARPPATPYGAFLDQLDAGNVASVVFHGVELDGRFKQPLDIAAANGAAPTDAFRSRVPDFGDPALISELRKHHVAADAVSPSPWTSSFGGNAPAIIVILSAIIFAKPGVLVFGGLLVAGLVRALRGGTKTAQQSTVPSNPMSMHPMYGMVKFTSGLFSKQPSAESPTDRDESCPIVRQGSLPSSEIGSDLSHGRP